MKEKPMDATKPRKSVRNGVLENPSTDYDPMVATMQTAKHAAAVDRLLAVSETEMQMLLDA